MRTSRAAVIGTIAAALLSTIAFAQEARQGTISRLDEATGTIVLTEAQAGTIGSASASAAQEFKLQDGLMFNALKEGDRVTYTAQDIGGIKTITKLERQ